MCPISGKTNDYKMKKIRAMNLYYYLSLYLILSLFLLFSLSSLFFLLQPHDLLSTRLRVQSLNLGMFFLHQNFAPLHVSSLPIFYIIYLFVRVTVIHHSLRIVSSFLARGIFLLLYTIEFFRKKREKSNYFKHPSLYF